MTVDQAFVYNKLDNIRKNAVNGGEYWIGRDIQPLLGYTEWRNFEGVIKKAQLSCESIGVRVLDHFVETNNMVVGGSGAKLERADYYLTRYACYLIAMNGDPAKPEVGCAQTYFAVQTRRMETLEALNEDARRLELRSRVKVANRSLNAAAMISGVKNYGFFHDEGYRGLYGMKQKDIKQWKGIPQKQALLDRMGRTELAANEFRITQCEEKLTQGGIHGEGNARKTHHEVGRMVRETIQQIGGTMPENLKPAPPIKEIEKKLRPQKQLKK